MKALFLKTHVAGYTRTDGTYVLPHERRPQAASTKSPDDIMGDDAAHYATMKRTMQAWARGTADHGANAILSLMGSHIKRGDYHRTMVLDDTGEPCALALHKMEANGTLYVDLLASRPQEFGKVRGAGLHAICEMIRHAIAAGGSGQLSLDSVEDAIDFYEHIGFENVTKNNRSSGQGDFMSLRPPAAKALLERVGLFAKAVDPWLERAYALEAQAGTILARPVSRR